MRYRHFITAFILAVSLFAFYLLSQRLIAQLHFHKAKDHLRNNYYGLAITRLEKAIQYQDNDYTFWNYLGRAYHKLGLLKPTQEAFLAAQQAKHAYLKAAELNPHDAEAAYGLAREEARLERLHARLHPDQKDDPYEPIPFFQEAIRLRPNSISYHYALARYLDQQGETEQLIPVVTNLARIYPPACSHLKNEAFWSQQVKGAVKSGLAQAIEKGRAPEQAHMALYALLVDEEDWAGAISHFQEALALRETGAQSSDYLQLGRLYLESGQLQDAEENFVTAIALSADRDRDLEGLYRAYKTRGYSEELYAFYKRVRRTFARSASTDILFARSLIDLEQHDQAQQILKELNQEEPHAEAYYWLYRIAQKQDDWDRMELSIQKATVLEPDSSYYHLLFSQVLTRLKKLDRAEKEAGLAIKHATRPSVSLFNHRASIRWTKKDYQGAVNDWKSALPMQPKNASLHARIAEAYLMLGELAQATYHYKKALQMEPNNQTYQQKLQLLQPTQSP
jgi:tetratricopeptide (TPR) repeat protein